MPKHLEKKRSFWLRFTIAIVMFIFFTAAAVIWILTIKHLLQSDWSNILASVFTIIGVLATLLQWFFPFSSEKADSPLFSQVTLVDASLDPHDSPYEQIIENGEKKIRLKDQQFLKGS